MSLQSVIHNAVAQTQKALGDLVLEAELIRGQDLPYQPGKIVVSDPVPYTVHVVKSEFTLKEIDNDRILASDCQMIIFHGTSIIPKPNDLVKIPNDASFRLVKLLSVHAGSEIVLSVAQARPVG